MNCVPNLSRAAAQSLARGFFLLLPLLLLAGCEESSADNKAAPGEGGVDPVSAFNKQMTAYQKKTIKDLQNQSDNDILTFSEGTVEIDLKFGFKMSDGKIISPARFDDVRDFTEGIAVVRLGKKWGYIDRKGAFVIEPRFDEARNFFDGRAAVRLGDKWGFVDRTGKLAVKPRFEVQVHDFREGRVPVGIGRKYGFINRDGKLVIAAKYDDVFAGFKDGFAPISRDGNGASSTCRARRLCR